LAALFVFGTTLCASPAQALTVQLTPSGAEPNAAGQATIDTISYRGKSFAPYGNAWFYSYSGNLTVTCQGLTPGATYWTSAGTVKAAQDGTLHASVKNWSFFYKFIFTSTRPNLTGYWVYPIVLVSRVNSDGSCTVVLAAQLPLLPRPGM
jgi:hypothetical protein